ncbi:hypothetical protein JXJ21_15805 [candidate division KSB1 bacterium]|nr:hypothetical protein [candidate division KSB1 bacterium]
MIINIIGGCDDLIMSQSELNAYIENYVSELKQDEDELHSGATKCGICEAASLAAQKYKLRIEGFVASIAIKKGILDPNYDRINIIKGNWGDEIIPCISEFEKRGKERVLTLCFDGGNLTKRFAEELIRRNFSVLLIKGSKRATDELIKEYSGKENVFVADLDDVAAVHRIISEHKAKGES